MPPMDSSQLLIDGPGSASASATLVLAHGAGAPMDSPFMATVTRSLAEAGIRVVRFEFPYMAGRRSGGRRPPDREAVLLQAWREVVAQLGGSGRLFIGGKSMGGRMASMVADELGVHGLVCLGYPFHAPGRPEKPRIAHLLELHTPALIVQGARDPFGNEAAVAAYGLPPGITVRWLADGDHDFKPRAFSGHTQASNLASAMEAASAFVRDLSA